MMDKALNIVSSSSSFSPPSSWKDGDPDGINSGRPIRFVYLDKNGDFMLDPHAIDVLQRIKGPVAVVSVCGPARQGKSFILNQLLGKSTGFQIASTHQPCTSGLWMWSIPLKKITLDGTEYDLLLLDSGGINTYDQTGMHSTQIISLAVLLSSLFVYNQVGIIDEAALDHLSLVAEMTKDIHGKVSEGNDLISQFGHTPVFIWLLRDFYLDLVEGDTRITPHDYLERALRPMLGSGKDIAAKHQICESIQAVFPIRECFTLVRPLNNETDLQHLDQVSLDKFRPEFRSGLDAFTKLVYERTSPKQVGGTTVTGPILATITKSFLYALNNGIVPTVSSLWQVYTRETFLETELQCSDAIKSMEKKLQEVCQAADARIENVAMILESLLSEYGASVHGPMKWQKLSTFLQKRTSLRALTISNAVVFSLQGPILLHAKKLIDEISLEKNSLMFKCCSSEDKIELLQKQLEASDKLKAEYQKRYEDAIEDFKKVSDQYKSRIIDLEQKCSLLEERCSASLEMLDSAKLGALQWERKYEEILTKKEAGNEQFNAKTAVLKSQVCEEKAKIAAAAQQSQLALKEAKEWKGKYDTVVNESKAATEKAAEQAKHREEALRAKFIDSLAEKDKEIKEMIVKLDEAEHNLGILTSDLKAAETKMENYDMESSALKLQIKELAEKYEFVKATSQSMEKDAQTLIEEKIQLQQKYLSELKRFEEAHEMFKVSEEEKIQLERNYLAELKRFEEAHERFKVSDEEKIQLEQKYLSELKRSEEAHERFKVSDEEKIQLEQKYLSELKRSEEAHERFKVSEEEKIQLERKYLSELKRSEEAHERFKVSEEEKIQLERKYLSELKRSEEAHERFKVSEEEKIQQEQKYLTELKRSEEAHERFKVSDDEKIQLEQKYLSELKRSEEAHERFKVSEEEKIQLEQKYLSELKKSEEVHQMFNVSEEDKIQLEQKYLSELKRSEEAHERFKVSEEEKIQLEQKYLSEIKRSEEAHERFKVSEEEKIQMEQKYLSELKRSEEALEMFNVSEEDKIQLEQKYLSELKRSEEAHQMFKVSEEEKIQLEQKYLSELKRSEEAHERFKVIEEEKFQLEQKYLQYLSELKRSEEEHERFKVSEEEIQLEQKYLCELNRIEEAHENFKVPEEENIQLEHIYLSELKIFEEAHERFKVSEDEAKINEITESLQSEMFSSQNVNSNESGRRRSRLEVSDVGFCSVEMETPQEIAREKKKPKSSSTLQKCTTDDFDSTFKEDEEADDYQEVASVDYTKLTVMKLRQELQKHGFGSELQKLKHPKKKDILALYRTLVLKK